MGLVMAAPRSLTSGGTLAVMFFLPDNQAIVTTQQKSQRFNLANLILSHLFSVSYRIPKCTRQNANDNRVSTMPS